MTHEPGGQQEETLDPADWASMRALGHRMLDDALDHVASLRDKPVWPHAPDAVTAHFQGPPPLDPQPPEEVYGEYVRFIYPHQIGNCHPRFWGWVAGTGTVMGMYAEMLAAATDAVSGSFSFLSNNYVELQVLDWCKSLLGYPPAASGLLTSGCSASNKEHGAAKFGRLVQQNIDQAHYLAGLVEAAPELELALPVSLNVVCFRYARPHLDDAARDRLTKQIEIELQEQGIALPSVVTIRGRKYLHVAITNHRSCRGDLDCLVREVIRIGHALGG